MTTITDLPKRELEILTRVADGRTNGDIAAELGVAERTVSNTLATLYLRLGVDNRVSAARWFWEHRESVA